MHFHCFMATISSSVTCILLTSGSVYHTLVHTAALISWHLIRFVQHRSPSQVSRYMYCKMYNKMQQVNSALYHTKGSNARIDWVIDRLSIGKHNDIEYLRTSKSLLMLQLFTVLFTFERSWLSVLTWQVTIQCVTKILQYSGLPHVNCGQSLL